MYERANFNKSSLSSVFLLLLTCLPLSSAQSNTEAGLGRSKADDRAVLPFNLQYDEPRTYPIGSKQSAPIADFKCGSDGSVFLPMLEDTTALNNEAKGTGPVVDRSRRFLLTALTPSGGVVKYLHPEVRGLRNFTPAVRYFVSPTEVFGLETAQRYDPADPERNLGAAHLVFIYSYNGDYKGVLRLEPGLNPVTIAAFPSGDVLVVSLDKFNQTTRLLVYDQAGRFQRELSLFDEDYGKKPAPHGKGTTADSADHSLATQLALAHWTPFGDNLVMSPNVEALPIIEINEGGVVRSTHVTLPDKGSVGGMLSSTDGMYHIVSYQANEAQPATANGQQGVFRIPTKIDDVFPVDGAVVRRVRFARGLKPVCAREGGYTFLTSREEDGKLQIVRASISH